jgi:IS30 family transposase
MAGLTQQQCNAIERKLNKRPRKRLMFQTPMECFNESSVSVALQS